MLGLLTLVFGIYFSYLSLNYMTNTLSSSKVVYRVFALYLSFIILFGFYMDLVGITVSMGAFLLLFLGGILFIRTFLIKEVKHVSGDFRDVVILFLISAIGFLYFVYPSIPSFFPIGAIQDPARHFALSQYIYETESLVHGVVEEWGGGTPVSTYPFGFHLNLALFSKLFNVPLLQLIFSFSAFIVALSGGVIYEVSKEFTSNKTASLFGSFFFVTSVIIHQNLSLFGAYPMLMGGFLILVFTGIIKEYVEDPDEYKLAVLIILEVATLLTYPFWALVGLSEFLFSLYLIRKKLKMATALHLLSFVFFSSASTILFWIDKLNILKARLSESGPILENPLVFTGTIVLSLAILGFIKYEEKNFVAYSFLAAVLTLSLVMLSYSILYPFSSYWYNKIYYFLEYPIIIFSSIGLATLIGLFLKYYQRFDRRRGLLFSLVILLFFSYMVSVKVGKVEETRHRSRSLTEEEYEFAKWIRENLPRDEKVSFVNFKTREDFVAANWIIAISRHGIDDTGNTVITRDITILPPDKLREYTILHQTGKVAILRKRQ